MIAMEGDFYKYTASYRPERKGTTARTWCGRAGLARTERRTGREGPGTKTGAGHEGRRNVTKGFTASGAVLGRSEIGAQPVAPGLAHRIDALHRRAGHEGHSAFPQRPTSSLAEVSSPG